MKIQVDLKTLITLGGLIAMLSGFMYTTILRLDTIEADIVKIEQNYHKIYRRIKKPNAKKR